MWKAFWIFSDCGESRFAHKVREKARLPNIVFENSTVFGEKGVFLLSLYITPNSWSQLTSWESLLSFKNKAVKSLKMQINQTQVAQIPLRCIKENPVLEQMGLVLWKCGQLEPCKRQRSTEVRACQVSVKEVVSEVDKKLVLCPCPWLCLLGVRLL